MKYLKQFFIIMAISFVGEILHYLIPLPFPASIYGVILMFIGLMSGIIPLNSVKDTAYLLIDIMPITFVPATVGLMDSWGILKSSLVAYVTITILSTFIVMVISGLVTQWIIRLTGKASRSLNEVSQKEAEHE
jgi:holin-like protein